ncbi:probable alpha-mannosidase At5g66150 [Magnolia sinica]|uniref:probable alpha-mannosidase At5g66150 n=1 Tax=Magnolia sinica TaxID=86752 RepID=UPI002659D8DE|nr:probable alpha-mannosidase At5g66150 [Magnolia sinica]
MPSSCSLIDPTFPPSIRESLIRHTRDFNIVLNDIAITHLSYSAEFSKAVDALFFSFFGQQCHLLNITYCPPTEEIPENKSLVVVAYNLLGWIHTDIVRIPVNDDHHVIRDSSGNTIEAQYVEMDNATINLRNFYTKAYLGVSAKEIPNIGSYFKYLCRHLDVASTLFLKLDFQYSSH